MATKTLLISTLTDANPYTIGSAPDNLTGYTKPSGSDNARVSSSTWYLAGATETMWLDDTILSGTTIFSRVKIGATASPAAAGAVIADINGTGYEVIFGTTAGNFRVFATLNGKLNGSVLAGGTFATSPVANAWVELSHTGTTLTVKQNGSTLGSVTGITRPTNARAGMSSRGGVLVGLESEYAPSQTVTSINGGSPITSSQSAVAAITTGFTGLPATITTNATGVTCGTITGSTNAPAWVQTVRTDGAVFPKSGTVVTYTFTNGAETASGTQTINKDADQTAVIVASPINDNTTCLFGAIFAATGRSAASSDEVYHTVPAGMSDLVVNPDGTMETTNAGTFDCWVWTAATGVNYFYQVTITENGTVIIDGMTSSGLASSGLTSTGLTSAGL